MKPVKPKTYAQFLDRNFVHTTRGTDRHAAIAKSDASLSLFRLEYGTRTNANDMGTGSITEHSNCQSISHKAGYKTKSTHEICPDERSKFAVGTLAVDEDGKPFLTYTVKQFPVKDLKITQRLSGMTEHSVSMRDTRYKDSAHLSLTRVRCDFEHISDVLNGSVPQRLRKEFPQEFPENSKEKAEDSLVSVPSRTWVKKEGASDTWDGDKGKFTKKGTVLRSRYSSGFAVRSAYLQTVLHPKESRKGGWAAPDFGTVHPVSSDWLNIAMAGPSVVKVVKEPIPDRVWPRKVVAHVVRNGVRVPIRMSGPASDCMAGPDVYRLGSDCASLTKAAIEKYSAAHPLKEWLQEVRKEGPQRLAEENTVDKTLYAASGYTQHADVWCSPWPLLKLADKFEPVTEFDGKFTKYPVNEVGPEVGPRESYLRFYVEPEHKSWTDAEWEALTPKQRKDAMAELCGFFDLYTKTPELWASRYEYTDSESEPKTINYTIVAWKPRASAQRHTGRTTKYSPEDSKAHDELFLANALCGLMHASYDWPKEPLYMHSDNVGEVIGRAKGFSCVIPVRKASLSSRDGLVCRVWTPLVRDVKDYCIASVNDKYSKLELHTRTREQEDEYVLITTKEGTFGWSKDDVMPSHRDEVAQNLQSESLHFEQRNYTTTSTHRYEADVENFLVKMDKCKYKIHYLTKKDSWVIRCGGMQLTISDDGHIRSGKRWKHGNTVEERGKSLDWTEALTHCHLSWRHGNPARRDFWEGCAAICKKAGGTTAAGFVLDQPKKGDVLKQPKDKLVQMQEGYTSELDSALWGESVEWNMREMAEEWKHNVIEAGTSSKDIFNIEEPENEDESDASE